eukprot:325192_1
MSHTPRYGSRGPSSAFNNPPPMSSNKVHDLDNRSSNYNQSSGYNQSHSGGHYTHHSHSIRGGFNSFNDRNNNNSNYGGGSSSGGSRPSRFDNKNYSNYNANGNPSASSNANNMSYSSGHSSHHNDRNVSSSHNDRNDRNSANNSYNQRQESYAPRGFRMIISGFDDHTHRHDILQFASQAGKTVKVLQIYDYKNRKHAIASYQSKSEFEYA